MHCHKLHKTWHNVDSYRNNVQWYRRVLLRLSS